MNKRVAFTPVIVTEEHLEIITNWFMASINDVGGADPKEIELIKYLYEHFNKPLPDWIKEVKGL